MDNTKRNRIKLIAYTVQVILLQVLIFFVIIVLLSVFDVVLAFLLNYDKGKTETTFDTAETCLIFFLVVALPTSIAAAYNKPLLFRRVVTVSMILMEIYIIYHCVFFGNVTAVREFIVLSLASILSCGISFPVVKKS